MSWKLALLLTMSSLLAAAGQVLFKYATNGRHDVLQQLNPALFAGFFCYGVGAVLWIYCMARVPLLKAYPFTSLTFMVTILAGVLVFGEKATLTYWVGLGLILAGLLLVSL